MTKFSSVLTAVKRLMVDVKSETFLKLLVPLLALALIAPVAFAAQEVPGSADGPPSPAAETRTAEPKYAETYRFAYLARQEGKWLISQRLMRRVIDMSTADGAPAKKRAVYWYEYGRASGVVCDWENAEFALTVSRNLDQQSGGPVVTSLVEKGRMRLARKQYAKAVEVFALVAATLPGKVQPDNPEALNYALYLEDFASALEQAGDAASNAKKLRTQASELRANVAGKKDLYEDRTPYGMQCNPG